MTPARWITASATLFGLWLLGATVFVPRIQRDLQEASQAALETQSTLAKRMGRLELRFEGQQARVSGKVRTQGDRLAIETTLRDLVRVPTPLAGSLGMRLNPVSSVRSEIEIAPYPAGWMLLAASGPQARLLGTAANDYEARDLAHSVQESWNATGGVATGVLGADGENHDEAASVSATLRGVPSPQDKVRAYVTRIGQPWQEFLLQRPDETLHAEAQALGISEAEWLEKVLPALRELRQALAQDRVEEAERQRLAALPAGHLFIAARGQSVILRGEVGSTGIKQRLLDDALAAFSPRRVQDEIRVSAARRPSGEFGPVTTALMPDATDSVGKSLFLCFSSEGWKPVDWQVASDARPWLDRLPSGVSPALLQNDSTRLINWLQGATDTMPESRRQPAFVTLALFDTKAILSGQVAEEASRLQIIEAVRRVYAPRLRVIHDDFRVNGDCPPSANVLHTTGSLPTAPTPQDAGVFAIAIPGGSWTVLPVTHDLIEAGGLARSKRLPSAIPAALVEERSADAIEQLRIHSSPAPLVP